MFNKCSHPYIGGTSSPTPFGCGKCPYCRKRRSDGWIVRIEQELKQHTSALFCTFTYQDGECDRTPSNFLTLNPKHLELLWKQLRTDYFRRDGENRLIKYYACGEYGGRTNRPHYHAILFGAEPEMVENAWRTSDGVLRGFVHFGSVTSDSIAYCTKYVMKPKRIPMFKGDDRFPEFQRSSTKLGLNYLTPQMLRWHRADLSRFYVLKPGGFKVALPRYYRDKIFLPSQLEQHRKDCAEFPAREFVLDKQAYVTLNGSDVGYYHGLGERHKRNSEFHVHYNRNTL